MGKSVLYSICLLLFVVMSSSVLAETKTIHDAWHEYAETFVVDGKVINIRMSENNLNILRVKIDNYSDVVEYQKCNDYDYYDVCFLNQSLEHDKATVTDETGKLMPAVHVKITYYDVSSDLAITPVLGSFNIYQTYQVNVTFKNLKPQWIEFFTYEITLPSDVTIVSKGDFTPSGQSKLTYVGSLPSNQEKIASFTITSQKAGAKTIKFNTSITSQGLSKSSHGTYSLTVVSPYTITATLSPANVNVLDTSRLIINVKNSGTANLELTNLTMAGPVELYYTASRGLEVIDFGTYYLSSKETIYPGKEKELYFIVTPQYLGKYEFVINTEMLYNGGKIYGNKNASLTASANGFMPVLALSKDAALSNSNVEVLFTLENTNSDTTFHDVSVDIQGGFFSEQLTLSKLNTNDKQTLLRKVISVPYVEEDTTYKVNATTTYYTQAGEKKQINSTRSIKITSAGTLLSLSHKLSAKEIYEGNELIVELNAKNMKEEVFQIAAVDVVPQGTNKIGGIVTKSMMLNGLASESVYIYKLFIPLNSGLTEINISSNVTVPAKGYSKSLDSIVVVKRNLSSTVAANTSTGNNNTLNPDDIVVTPDLSAPKKDGVLKRFVKSISSFFEEIFS